MSLTDRDTLTVDRRVTGTAAAIDALGNPVTGPSLVPQSPLPGLAMAIQVYAGGPVTLVVDDDASTLTISQPPSPSAIFNLGSITLDTLASQLTGFNFAPMPLTANAVRVAVPPNILASTLADATINIVSWQVFTLHYLPLGSAGGDPEPGFPKQIKGHFQRRTLGKREREEGLFAIESDAILHSYQFTDGKVNDLVSPGNSEWFRVIDATPSVRVNGKATALYQLKRVE